MDKLKLNLAGRMPLLLEDLEFQDTYFREAIEGLLKAFDTVGNTGFVVSGCVLSESGLTAGYIYLNGELIKVEAQPIGVTSGTFYISKQTTDDTSRTFGDGTTKTVRSVVRGIGDYYSLNPPTSKVLPSDTLLKRIRDGLYNDGWVIVILGNDYDQGTPSLKYRLNKMRNVEITGSVVGNSQGTVATLPAGYRPPYEVRFLVVSGGFPNVCSINTDGVIALAGIPQEFGPTEPVTTYIHTTLFMT